MQDALNPEDAPREFLSQLDVGDRIHVECEDGSNLTGVVNRTITDRRTPDDETRSIRWTDADITGLDYYIDESGSISLNWRETLGVSYRYTVSGDEYDEHGVSATVARVSVDRE